jgi:membrane protease YdiL (CAAX protease family)
VSSAKRPVKNIATRYDDSTTMASSVRNTPARTTTSRVSQSARPWARTRLNTRFTFLIYAAVAAGTITLDATLRTTILWSVLAVLLLAHIGSQPLTMRYQFSRVQRGALLGLLLTLPLAFLARDVLLTLASSSLGTASGSLLFQRLVFIAAPLEELYYRGYVQRDRGTAEATLLYAIAALLIYWPTTQGFWAVLATMVLGSALLGALFAWVNKRFGLSAAIACHIACNLCLFILPSVLHDYSRLIS